MSELREGIAAAAIGDLDAPGPETASRRYRFSPGFVGFSGHFPGDPILPAIVEMRTVVSMAEELSGKPLRLVCVESAKFLSPIRPGEVVDVRYHRRDRDGKALYDATLSVAGKTAASFLLQLDEAGEER